MTDRSAPVRLAAIADIHCARDAQGSLQALFAQVAEAADMLLLCGDLTDYGLPEEARVLAKELSGVRLPMVGVLGNHDFESGQEHEIVRILGDAGVRILDGESHEIDGVGFAGVKGFAGGFGRGALGPWGERIIKEFVNEAVAEALKLESALARLQTPHRIAMLHYSPVRATVEGEPPEIFPYLGSSRLEEPINRYRVSAVFHGHAHRGTAEGRTSTGVPVYNVAMPLMARLNPERPPYLVLELPLEDDAPETAAPPPLGEPVVKTA